MFGFFRLLEIFLIIYVEISYILKTKSQNIFELIFLNMRNM